MIVAPFVRCYEIALTLLFGAVGIAARAAAFIARNGANLKGTDSLVGWKSDFVSVICEQGFFQ